MEEKFKPKTESRLLSVRDLAVEYKTEEDTVKAVNKISFDLDYGDSLGLVGETGAGKTTIAKAILQLLPDRQAKITNGEILLDGNDLLKLSEHDMQNVRGKRISMVFQDPMTSLNPVKRVCWQIEESMREQLGLSKQEAEKKAREIFEMVGITSDRFREYPHQFSGGMKQRVVIAIALACNPDLLIADEPTTALDVTIQAQVLEVIKDLQTKNNMSLIMITHDFGVVANSCNKVGVVYAGEIIEFGTIRQVLEQPKHPYTKGLFEAIPTISFDIDRLKSIHGAPPDPTKLVEGCKFYPRCEYAFDACKEQVQDMEFGDGHRCKCCLYANGKEMRPEYVTRTHSHRHVSETSKKLNARREVKSTETLIELRNLKKYFATSRGALHAVDDVSLTILKGKTMGVVGESGCGKSTLGRTIIHLLDSTGGQILYQGKDITYLKGPEQSEYRHKMQIIFQDPNSSLNPRMTVEDTITEPMLISKRFSKNEMREKANELMNLVGVDKRMRRSYPHELDGGRRQRVGIARALAMNPEFIVCDEPVSALDVSIQAQILNLLQDLQISQQLTYMFVTHDMSVVRHLSDDICVMYLGQVVEISPAKEMFKNPMHPYTKVLLSAIPSIDLNDHRKRIITHGELSSPIEPAPGCRFANRCPYAKEECSQPQTHEEVSANHFVSCCRVREINA